MNVQTFKLYPDREDVTLTAYILDYSPVIQFSAKRPGMLICPGGGYEHCSDREAEPVALKFATMGYHAFVLRYSVQNENGHSVEDGPVIKPRLSHPAPVREIGMSFILLHEHAEEWLLDTEKIAICGFSAGGHNCAMYAVYWNTELVRDALGVSSDTLRPAAAILGYPLMDLLLIKEVTDSNTWKDGVDQISFFGTSDPSDELLEKLAPERHLSSDTPPCLIWSTAEDGSVPVQQSLVMAKACADANIPFELHIYEQGPHGLSLADITTARSGNQINPTVADWITHAREFLERRFETKTSR